MVSNFSLTVEEVLADTNSTEADRACSNMSYGLLSCVAGTLTLVPYLRVSSLPKIILLLLLSVTYTVIMETSGYRQAVGLDTNCMCRVFFQLSNFVFVLNFFFYFPKKQKTHFMCVCFRGGFLHTRGYDPVLAALLFFGALALHSRQLDLKLRLDYLWATQVHQFAQGAHLLQLILAYSFVCAHTGLLCTAN